MHTVILSPREQHNVRSLDEYRRAHATAIARKVRSGHRLKHHVIKTPLQARIDHGAWIVDCECGAGNAVDPAWPVALCFGCGAEHAVVFPAEVPVLETLILARPQMHNRNWTPGESLRAVRALNKKHGVVR